MKKAVSLALILCMIMVLASCGKKEDTGSETEPTKAAEVTTEAETTKEPEVTQEPETTPEATPEITPEATPEVTETPQPTQEEIESLDISKLAGQWYESNSLTENTLVVNEDGTIELIYLGGGTKLGSITTCKGDDGESYYGLNDVNGNVIGKILPEEIFDNFITVYTPEDGEFYFQRDTNPGLVPDLDVVTGNWQEQYDDSTNWEISIFSDGSWFAYRDGEQNEGYVKFKRYDVDGIPYMLDLCTFDGGYWTGIVWNWDTEEVNEIKAFDVRDSESTFTRVSGNEYPEYVPGDEYTGKWQNDEFSMTVYREGAGAFIFEIIQKISDTECFKWSYWTFYYEEDEAFHSEGTGAKWLCNIDSEGDTKVVDTLSLEEKADFAPYEDTLMFWIDQYGDIEGEVQFERVVND